MIMTSRLLAAILIVILAVSLFGFVFKFLFKVGLLLLVALGVIYLLKRILN